MGPETSEKGPAWGRPEEDQMAISIRTNYSSLDAQRNLTSNQEELDSSMRKLASGYRITRAADDAAGLAVSEKMRAAVGGTSQAIRNANDGISMIQTAEGGLSEISNIVIRVRELAVQAANGTLVTADRVAVAKEINQVTSEIDAIAERSNFNGITLLNSTTTVTLQIGANNNTSDKLEVVLSSFKTTDALASFGSVAGSFVGYSTAGLGSLQAIAQNLLDAADSAIEVINNKRAELGAAQNRLGNTIAVQQVASDNLANANSRIRDVDVASESARLTRANILAQAGVSVLAQANQMPQLALKLIG